MNWRTISSAVVQICALTVLILGTVFAFTAEGYPLAFVLLLGIGWSAGLVGLVEARRGASTRAAAAFLVVAIVVPNFFAEAVNLLLVIITVAYVLASRRSHSMDHEGGTSPKRGMSRS